MPDRVDFYSQPCFFTAAKSVWLVRAPKHSMKTWRSAVLIYSSLKFTFKIALPDVLMAGEEKMTA